jgi:hypothetical protein
MDSGSLFDESEQVRVDDVTVCGAHALVQGRIHLQRPPLDELGQGGIGDRYDLIVVAVYDEHQNWVRFATSAARKSFTADASIVVRV